MRKFSIALIAILLTFLCAACKPFVLNVDDYLSYWAGETYITDSTIKSVLRNDISGIPTVPSAVDVSAILKLQNPKLFELDLPPAVDPAKKVIVFEHVAHAPRSGIDYTLTQSEDRQSLTLTYKASFLQAHEWGEQDLSSTLTLYAKDGRKFKQTYTVKLKANTPPPNPTFTVVKTTGSPAYYVLCITVPDMDKTVPAGLLHKDLARIEVNGTPYTFSVNKAQTAFTKPEADVFITHSDVEKLSEPDADAVPADSSWVLYYKTDVEVRDGAAKKDYTIKVIDEKGLVSGIVNASTKPNKAETETIRITKGTKISGSGSETDPMIIGTDSTGAVLSVSSATANTTVHCTVNEIGGSTPVQYDGNPVTVPLALNGTGEKQYKLEYYTDGGGFAATPVKTVYYKVVEGHTVTFDANGGAYPDGTTAVSKTALHGTAVSAPDPLPAQQGFSVTGWYKDKACSAGQAWNFTTDTVTGDITLYAQWTASGGIPYTVEHYKQNVNDDNYPTAPTDTDNATGTTGANAAVTPKNYPGFKTGTYTAATIAADGSTVVKVYYQRKQITVTFKPNGGTIDGSTADKPVTGKYGAPLMAPTASWTGHGFSGWNPPLSAGSTFPEENAEYTARWDLNSYLVTYTVDGAGGKIKIGSGNPTTNSTISVTHGGNVTFTADPDTGYEVENWSSNVTVDTSDNKKATLSNVTGNGITVTVKFKKTVYNVTFNVVGGTGGTLKARPEGGSESTTGSVSVEHGKKITFTADPDTVHGYEVKEWTVDGNVVSGHTSTSYELSNVTSATTVTVKFKKKVYKVTFSVVDGEGGKLQGSYGSQHKRAENGSTEEFTNVSHGDSVSFNAVPADGWAVEGWTLGGTAVNGIYENYTSPGITANTTVTVKFKKRTTIEHGDNLAWTLLKNVVKIADDNAVITIDGKIQASSGNSGEIEIDKTLTIKGNNGAGSDILDANSMSRIFKVKSGKTLILENLTLTGGKADEAGGAIFASDAFDNITNCTITGNEAATNGGGLNIEGTPATITNCTFTRNTAKNGGGIYINKTAGSIPAVTISGGTIGGTGTNEANKATGTGSDGNGGGIYVGEFCSLKLQDYAGDGVRIIGNQAAKGGGVYAKNTIVSMQGRTQIAVDNNDVYLDSGSDISVVESLTATAPVARITVPNDKYQTTTQVLRGSAVSTEYRKFTVTPKGSEHWTVRSDGRLTNNKTDIFNTITNDQIEAAIDAAAPSLTYDNWQYPITNRKAKLTNKLVLYKTAQGNYGIMHVTEVDNTTYGGKGHIKFNSKTFNQYGGVLREETDKVLTGDESFQFEAGRDPGGNLDFTLGNGTTDEEKTFKPLNGAKFYILSN